MEKARRNSAIDSVRMCLCWKSHDSRIFLCIWSSSGRPVTSGIGTVGVQSIVESISGTWAILVLRASAVRSYLVSCSVAKCSNISLACRILSSLHDLKYRYAFVIHIICTPGSNSDGSFCLVSSYAHVVISAVTLSLSGSPSNSVVVFQNSVTLDSLKMWYVHFLCSCVGCGVQCLAPSCTNPGDSWSRAQVMSGPGVVTLTVTCAGIV